MRVLWLSPTPSMYDEKKYGGWVASLELVFRSYLKEIEVCIIFEYPVRAEKKHIENITYYPVNLKLNLRDRISSKCGYDRQYYQKYVNQILKIVNDFKPDIIQCFGSEWFYGLIAKYVDIPVVIHMQGFMNIYNLSSRMAYNRFDTFKYHTLLPKTLYHTIFFNKLSNKSNLLEQEIMKINHYFMGRTKWDENIVKYYSPNSKYFYCAEAIRPTIYNSYRKWNYEDSNPPRLVTITQAGTLKGNEIILRTAELLKKQFGQSFTWRVAGNINSFKKFEKKTGIKHEDVNIELLGMISADQIVDELSAARLYIHPAIIDNSPNSLCEAQIIGCPVIASYVGGIPSLVNDGETGFLFPYNEPHTLAFLIMNYMNNKNKLEEVSKNEIRVAHRRHDPETISKQILTAYENIIKDFKEQ